MPGARGGAGGHALWPPLLLAMHVPVAQVQAARLRAVPGLQGQCVRGPPRAALRPWQGRGRGQMQGRRPDTQPASGAKCRTPSPSAGPGRRRRRLGHPANAEVWRQLQRHGLPQSLGACVPLECRVPARRHCTGSTPMGDKEAAGATATIAPEWGVRWRLEDGTAAGAGGEQVAADMALPRHGGARVLSAPLIHSGLAAC